MKNEQFPAEVLAQHTAVLGKTGSGKTSTAKLLVEQVVADEARVCVLDPIKSDWWGLTSMADGKRAGLPFHILGGPRGHVPLHERAGKAIGELVATGALPLSIIDMADFSPGGQQHFFVDFAPMLLKRMRGVVYLVVEEAHLFAPKERSGVGAENMSIHWAKMLATAGRSKGVRLVVVTQRTQALHNALLGSCDTMIVHRLTAPADQEPVVKWLAANTDRATKDIVSASLASLKTGEGWLCSGEARLFQRQQFPRIRTYDNTATPTGNGDERQVKMAAVDVDKLRSVIGDAVKEAEAADPKLLRQRIAQLEKELAAKKPVPKVDDQVTTALRRELGDVTRDRDALRLVLNGWHDRARKIAKTLLESVGDVAMGTRQPEKLAAAVVRHEVQHEAATRAAAATAPRTAPAQASEGVSGPQQRILDALAWFACIGVPDPRRSPLGAVAGSSPKSSGFEKNLSTLRTAGLIDYPDRGRVVLTDAGRAKASAPAIQPTEDALHEAIYRMVSGPQATLLRVLVERRGMSITREILARDAGVSAASSGFEKNISTLRSFELIDYPQRGLVCATDIMFPGGA